MILLAVDTSATVASAALLKDGSLIQCARADSDRKHAETLLPLVQDLLKNTGFALSDVDAFAVDIGPGSFTGVRIGVCAVNAMAFALDRPVVAVDSLRTLAEPYVDGAAPVLTLIDAGHEAAYCARYENGVCVMVPGARDTEALLASQPQGTLVIRDAIPDAAALAMAAWRMRNDTVRAAVPLYIQPSQAERLFEKRMGESAHE